MGALSDLLNQYGIKPEAVAAASLKLEALQPEDQDLYAKRAAKRLLPPDGGYEKAGIAKPRSGRPVSVKNLAAAVAGNKVPRKARGKVTRAVNALLKEAGKPAVTGQVLFGLPNMKKKDA
jgi:hypothetical protein